MIRRLPGVAGTVKVEIWSDVVCPWCYIGKRNFEAALAAFDHRDEVEVVWRSYELDPAAPAEREGDYAGRIAAKYGMTRDEAQGRIDRITTTAAGAGLAFDFDIARPGNTFDAHRLIHLGAARGVQDAVKERLLAATFLEGEPIGDHETLVRLGSEAGLDADEARAVLAGDAYADAVRADEREAAAYGISGVPFFVIDQTYGVSGAQPPEVFDQILGRAWAESHRPALVVTGPGDAEACEGDACDI
jgi:predicted DsbA family dithiol-disulfide isomerase